MAHHVHMESVTFRNARHEDADALLAVHQAAIRVLGREAYNEAECESWAFGLKADGYWKAMKAGETFIVATAKDGVVAFCSYTGEEIAGLFVHPGWSRRGIGRKLLSVAEERIRQAGSARIILDSALSAVPFYQAAGYTVIDRTPWTTRGGLELSSWRMAKVCRGIGERAGSTGKNEWPLG